MLFLFGLYRRFVQKVRSDHKQKAGLLTHQLEKAGKTVTKLHTGFNVAIMNEPIRKLAVFRFK